MPPRATATIPALFLLAACGAPNLTVPTAKFAQSVTTSAAAIETEFTGEFAAWQQSYITIHAIKGTPIDLAVLEGTDKPADEPTVSFSRDAIADRIKAIEAIKAYATALGSLAGTTVPADIATDGKKLETDLTGLVKTAKIKDPSFDSYAQPITDIAVFFGQQYAQNQRDAAIRAAVQNADQPFTRITTQLQIDLELLREDKDGMAARLLQLRVRGFNRAAKPDNEEKLTPLGTKVMDVETTRQALAHYAALDTITAWQKAEASLVTFLKSPQTAQDTASLTVAIDAFATQVQPLAAAVTAAKTTK
jgi:hypothetical protein